MNFKNLAELQRGLDTHIAQEKDLGDPYDISFLEKRKLALLVEIGEFANATRCFKYWSNKQPEPREVILEEAADCLHFTLSILILEDQLWEAPKSISSVYLFYKKQLEKCNKLLRLEEMFNNLFKLVSQNKWNEVLKMLCALVFALGFTPDELEQAYLEKHKKNHKRQEDGY